MAGGSRRRRRRRWRLSELLTRAGFVVGAVAATVGLFKLPGWVAATAVALPFGIALAGQIVYDREQQIKVCSGFLSHWPLPRLRDLDLFEVGPHRSKRAERHCPTGHPQCRGDAHRPPYVQRSQDGQLADLLERRQFVLVVGALLAGKSRSALEVARELLPGHRLVVPRSGPAIPEVEELRRSPLQRPDVVLWLDDLEGLLAEDPAADGLDRQLLVSWRRRGAPKVLATMSKTRYQRLTSVSGDVDRHVARTIRELGDVVALPAGHDERELTEIRRLYAGEDAGGGLGRWLFVADRLAERLEMGAALDPAGLAVVTAAVLWYRCTSVHWLSEVTLKRLYQTLCRLSSGRVSEVDWARGLDWALEPVVAALDDTSLLLGRSDRRGGIEYRAHGAILDTPELAEAPIRQTVWETVIGRASMRGTLRIGFNAYKEGNLDAAGRAWSRALASEDPAVAARAARFLGYVLLERGRADEAEEAFERATAQGVEAIRLEAWEGLGRARLARDDLQDAREAFAKVIEADSTGDLDLRARAALRLAEINVRLDDRQAAVDALRSIGDVSGIDDADLRARVAVLLGELSLERGDAQGARAALEPAVHAGRDGDPSLRSEAAYHLGRAYAELEQPKAAENAFDLAMRTHDPDRRADAALRLGAVRELLEDRPGADRAYRQAVVHGGSYAATAWDRLGHLHEHDDPARARGYFARMVDRTDPEAARRTGAPLERVLERLASGRDSAGAAEARFELGRLYEAQGRPDRALDAYRRAVEDDASDLRPEVAPRLGEVARRAEAGGDNTTAAEALFMLAGLQEDPRALQTYERAIDLGGLRPEHLLQAVRAVERLDPSNPDPGRALKLGNLYEELERYADARRLYEAAQRSGDRTQAGPASEGLGRIEAAERERRRVEERLRSLQEGPRFTRPAGWRPPHDPGRGAGPARPYR
jgi:tetratricopeptide (TPR) repeat protein